jgi:hypothetical protein
LSRDYPAICDREDEKTSTESVKIMMHVRVERVDPIQNFFVLDLCERIPAKIFRPSWE